MTGLATAHASMLQEKNLTGSDGNTVMSYQNFLINGGMDFAQRIAGGDQTGSNTYGLDRWNLLHNHSSVQVSRQTTSFTVPGARYCMRVANIITGAGSYLYLCQPFELENLAALLGRTVTISVYIRRSSGHTGNVRFSAVYSTNTEDGAAALVSGGTFIGETNIANSSLSTTFSRFSITVTVPSTARSFGVVFGESGVINEGQYIEVTGAMLNIGSSPAPFQRAGGTIGGELQLCQRYFEKSYSLGTAPGTVGAYTGIFFYQHFSTTLPHDWRAPGPSFKVPKRIVVTPVIYSFNGVGGRCTETNSETDFGATSAQVIPTGDNGFGWRQFSGTALTLAALSQKVMFHWAADAEL